MSEQVPFPQRAAHVLARFESLGGRQQGCEFGLVQRAAGLEPLGLMRWTEVSLRELLGLLDSDFAGVGDPAFTIVENNDWAAPGYITRDTRWGMTMHADITPDEMSLRDALAQRCRQISFLVRKLREDLRNAEKIFVFRETTCILSRRDMMRLHRAVSRWGGASLLIATYAHGEHAAGTVSEVAPGLYGGHFERFRIDRNYRYIGDVDEAWLDVCSRTLELHARSR